MSVFAKLYRKLVKSHVLENTGSTARDHLASERTFLAWVRTGLGLIALGIAIERFSKLEPVFKRLVDNTAATAPSYPKENGPVTLATYFTTLGSFTIIYGTIRYYDNYSMLQKNLYKPAFYGIYVVAGGVMGLCAYALYDTFWKTKKPQNSIPKINKS